MPAPAEYEIDREAYAELYGPTTGDMVRLADTALWIKVEKDYTHCKYKQISQSEHAQYTMSYELS